MMLFSRHFYRNLDVARMRPRTMRISLKIFQRRRVRGFQFYKSRYSHKWKDFQATLQCINLCFDFGRGNRRGWLFEISQHHDKVTRSVTSLCSRPALRESVSGYHPTLPTSGVQTSENETWCTLPGNGGNASTCRS